MIAVDTNILVHAHRKESPWHKKAAATIIRLAESPAPWAIPWPCVHEFFSITTHPRIYVPPTPPKIVINDLQTWFDSPSLRLLGEPVRYWEVLRQIVHTSAVAGPMVHDARIAAICRAHGVTTLFSADRDFSRFGIDIINPLTSE
ncbi:MAG: PIN domain-containing protein [Bryobacterales bacterium]|nr:PIN domain-containing protein [Bryobacterales bacterium]